MVEAERGYLIVAKNTESVDYIDCARALARSIKIHTPQAKICLLTDTPINDSVFDFVRNFPYPTVDGFGNDWQIFAASPFRQTIKLEADMIVPHSIWHWWTMLEHRDVVIALGARNYLNQFTPSRHYRKIFDLNGLPDVYNAITYWRLSQGAQTFFNTVRAIFENWPDVQKTLKGGSDDPGSTDVVYALAALIVGVENVTLPNTGYPSLIHMKAQINGLSQEEWTRELIWELDGSNIRINTVDQEYPFHYNIKDFSKVLNKHYDKLLAST